MASAAELRIREKAERLLREQWPDARIVHEFDLGGVRLDIAAITPDRLILLEIKSELDTLKRLDRQAKSALRIGGPLFVCYAARWRGQIQQVSPWQAQLLEETDEGFSGIRPMLLRPEQDRYDNRALLGLLLKPEKLNLARPFGGKAKHTAPELDHFIHENLSGRDLRRATMAALRERRFGWTCDHPIAALSKQGEA